MNAFTDANIIYDAGTKAMARSKWKYTTQTFEQNHLLETAHIQSRMAEGSYAPGVGRRFVICERGKTRDIVSVSAADKTVNHILCDEAITPSVAKYLQYDNSASQKGKGADFHRRRLEAHLRRYYAREGTNEGYILLTDFSGYYANIPHKRCMEYLLSFAERRADAETMESVRALLPAVFNAFGGGMGVGVGNQLSQDIGILYPYRIDDYIKIVRGVKEFGRYTDDVYVIHRSEEFLKDLLADVRAIAAELGITVSERKTRVCKLSGYFRHLQIQYSLTQTGRVIRKIGPKAITRVRRRLKGYKRLLGAGKMEYADVENCFKSWLCAHWKYMSRKQIGGIGNLYFELFERRPTWRKRHGRLRFLTGRQSQILKETATAS